MRFAPLWTSRFFTGLYTNRNPLRDAGSTRLEEKFYGARGDGFLAGLNVEISQRLTPIRRPGTSVYNSATFGYPATYPTPASYVNFFYEFRLFSTTAEQIKVMVDEGLGLYNGTGPSTRSLVWTKSAGAGQTFMQYIANILYFGNGVDQKKWVQSITPWAVNTTYTVDGMQTFFVDSNGFLQQLISTIVPISLVTIRSGIVTFTTSITTDLTKVLTEGLQVKFNLTTAAFLNSETLTLTAVTATTFTAALTTLHVDYGPITDIGYATVLEGGTPISSASPVSFSSTIGATTSDNTALWINRGPTIENFGIEAPTQDLSVNVGTSTGSWQPNTYYSILTAIIDSNGNLQTITTAGKSGGTVPTWANTVGATTIDGTVLWTCTELASSMVWAANTSFAVGSLIVATPTGSNPCVFQLQQFSQAQLSGPVTAYLYNSVGAGVGTFKQTYPASLSSALYTGTGNSLLINPPANPNTPPMAFATLNSSGMITGYTTPFTAHPLNNDVIILANLVISAPGNYTITINHVDGMFWGMGGGATLVSGPNNNPNGQTQTAGMGYTSFGGRNLSGESQGGTEKDTFIIYCPTAGTYPLEIDYNYRNGGNGTMCFYVNGNTPTPGTGSTTRTTGATQPTWPNFTTQYAPAYVQVSESAGQVVWANIGFVTDFSWHANTRFVIPGTSIVDNAGYIEGPFEAGVTATQAPTFVTTLNGLTPDNPNLIWINKGKSTAPTAGSLSTYNGGWSYCLALVNTLTDTVSNAGPLTTATGSFLGASGVTLTSGLPPNIDPQVDYVAIFRTEDGGGTYYLIPGTTNQNTIYTVPLVTFLASGYVDTTLDADLDIEVEPALAGENTPPPVGLINLTYHVGRNFGSVGNVVDWSSGPDTPVGNGYEGFAPLNSATYPSLVKRIVPTVIGALVFTVSDVYLIAGLGTSESPFTSAPYIQGLGLLSYNALSVNGTIIYMFSADSQVVSIDPHAGVSNVGIAIGDQFDIVSQFDPANVYVTWHVSGTMDQALYIGDGATGFYRMMTTPAPETGLTWSTFSQIEGGCRAVQSVEVSPGVHKLLIGPAGFGPIGYRDLTVHTDFGTAYPAYGIMGSIVLAQPGQLAEVAFISTDCLAIGTTPTLSVRLNEIAGEFYNLLVSVPDPPQLPGSTSIYNQRFYLAQQAVIPPSSTPTNASATLTFTSSAPLGNWFWAAIWSNFQLIQNLPNDAVIQSIWPVIRCGYTTSGPAADTQVGYGYGFNPFSDFNRPGTISSLGVPTSTLGFSAQQFWGGSTAANNASLGTDLSVLSNQTIFARLVDTLVEFGMNDVLTCSQIGYAIYYTTATPADELPTLPAGLTSIPPPYPVPAGQAVAWALPFTVAYGPQVGNAGATNGSAVATPTIIPPASQTTPAVLLAALCRHLQIQFAWPAENYANEMLSLTLYGAFSQER